MIRNLFVFGIGKRITARRIIAPCATTLQLGGIVNVGEYLTSFNCATLRETVINGGADMYGALVVGDTNVRNAITTHIFDTWAN